MSILITELKTRLDSINKEGGPVDKYKQDLDANADMFAKVIGKWYEKNLTTLKAINSGRDSRTKKITSDQFAIEDLDETPKNQTNYQDILKLKKEIDEYYTYTKNIFEDKISRDINQLASLFKQQMDLMERIKEEFDIAITSGQ